MKEITYNFLTELKELSKKYNFDGFLDVELSPSSFKPYSYYTEFFIHTNAENFTAMTIFNLLEDMKTLLTEVKYPVNLEYAFSITSNDGIIYNLFDDSYEPRLENRQSNKIEFPYDHKKEEQCYTLSLDRGKLTLEKDHEDEEEYFKENPELVDFLNSFIDNKIPKTIIPTSKEIQKDIRILRENLKDYVENDLITLLDFGFHYNNGQNGIYTSFEYYVYSEDYYIKELHKRTFTSNLPSYALFREVDMLNYTEKPLDYTKTKAFTTSEVSDNKGYFKKVTESFIQDTEIEFNNIKSVYINLNMLDYGSMYDTGNTLKIISDDKLLAQIDFVNAEDLSPKDFDKLKANIHKFLYETHAEGYSILATELEDDDSEFGGIPYLGFTLIRFIQEIGEPLSLVNNIEQLNQDLRDCGIKPLELRH